MIEIDGLTIVQSQAICRYVARRANMAGKDSTEVLKCDIVSRFRI